MNKRKIFNDPVYGFISYPFDIIYDLINHPYFQRLRRVSQLGLSHYVYPGALHTRFHHALGATHLMIKAILTLRDKNIDITDEEAEAVCIAILLHDIGHSPFSHALEHKILPQSHEEISLAFMEVLNLEFNGKLSMAIQVFKNEYPKKYLNQLVSSQLDMDRMDYLNRDSFYTGVAEGVIGYDRIIKMFNVRDNTLVIEEKGIYSIEKFILARRIMYWQVYLHKTVIAIEQMLVLFFKLLREKLSVIDITMLPSSLIFFLEKDISMDLSDPNTLRRFSQVDDIDIIYCIKILTETDDFLIKKIANGILNRQLFKIIMNNQSFSSDFIGDIRLKVVDALQIANSMAEKLVIIGQESNLAYDDQVEEILILKKNNSFVPFSEVMEYKIGTGPIVKHFVCFPQLA